MPKIVWADPSYRLRTIETEHFVIHYPTGTEVAAEQVARNVEKVYKKVTRALGHEISKKTHIVLSDTEDDGRGSANSIPAPRISMETSANSSFGQLANYEDWYSLLLTHEFTHVVNLDMIEGVPAIVNLILGLGGLGNAYSPSRQAPDWWIEGLATMEESDLGAEGRHRSAMFDMILRMAVLEHRFETIDRVTSAANVFPYGGSGYLYGLHLMHYLAQHYGRDKVEELLHVYSRRIIPGGLNRALRDVLGIDFDQLWQEFSDNAHDRFISEARMIRARGLRQGRRLTFSSAGASIDQHTNFPFWSPDDQWIYYYDDDGHRWSGIFRVSVNQSRIREAVGPGRQQSLSDRQRVIRLDKVAKGSFADASGESLIVGWSGTHDNRYDWHDLYRVQPNRTTKREQLTFGLRAREPSVSPDGKTVAFVRNDIIQSRIAFLNRITNDITELRPMELAQQVGNPTWSPDGKQIAFSQWSAGGYQDIYIYHRELEQYTRVTASRHMDTAPTWSPDGRFLLFSSDRSGVYNIYAWDVQERSLSQVTNVLGGAFLPTLSHDGSRLAYLGYSSTGFDVWVMDFDSTKFLSVWPGSSLNRHPELHSELLDPSSSSLSASSSRRYQAWRTFYPRTLIPSALEFESTEFLRALALGVEIEDMARLHRLTGEFRWLIDVARPGGIVRYQFNRLYPKFYAGFRRGFGVYSDYTRYVYDGHRGTVRNGDNEGYRRDLYLERQTQIELGVRVPLLNAHEHRARIDLQYEWNRYENLDENDVPVDPNAPASRPPEVGDLAGLQLRLSYANDQYSRFIYGDARGRKIAISWNFFDPSLGGDFRDLRVQTSYTEYIPMPWRGQNILALRASAGASSGDLDRRGSFSLGGVTDHQDIVRNVLNRSPFSDWGILRGYPRRAFSGRYYTLLNSEFRIPVVNLERGIYSLPLFLHRIVVTGFSDWGWAWSKELEAKSIKGSLGTSVIVETKAGYGTPLGLIFQYARGLDKKEGINYFRVFVGRSF